MKPIKVAQEIAAPIDLVFDLASDIPHAAERIKAITKVEMLTDGPVGVGTKFKETRVMFGKEASETMTFTAFNRPNHYAVVANSCGCIYDTQFNFAPAGAGTRVEFVFNATPVSFFAKLMSPLSGLMSGMLAKCVMQDLADIKAAAETKATGAKS